MNRELYLIAKKDKTPIWHPYTQAKTAAPAIPIARAEGAVLHGMDGKEYLDLISSWWVNLHGHAHPRIAEAIAAQAKTLEQVIFAGFTHQPAVELAARLSALLPADLERVFYSDNGSTAIEVALKVAYQFWKQADSPRKTRFLAFEGGYHGDTVGAMSMGASSGFFGHWKDLLFSITALPYPATWDNDPDVETKEKACLDALEAYLAQYAEETAALIVEPLVQGAAGMRMCRPEFLREVEKRLRAARVLLIFDEVMTGFGRTGDLFACLKSGATPDIICLSKGLSGGFLPLSVTVFRRFLHDAFLGEDFSTALAHGHSFTANPLGCAAALASLELLLEDQTARNIGTIVEKHRERLNGLSHPRLGRTRQCGTIAAVDVLGGRQDYSAQEGQALMRYFMDKGLLIRPLGHVIYLLPPYCVTPEQLDRAYDAIEAGARDILENP